VNIFRQRGSYAIVMRVIAGKIPTFQKLQLPEELKKIALLRTGAVLVTGPTGSGKSSTVAAIIDLINSTRAEHVITIEDPIEFMHPHKKSTIHQRELHTDTISFASALRAAMRQAPKVILVGEMRDKETIEIALTAAETGHLVLSTLHTIDAAKTVERIVGTFPLSEQGAIRTRLAATVRYFVAQKLLPRKNQEGRTAICEILKSTLRTRSYIEQGEKEGKSLLDAIRTGTRMECSASMESWKNWLGNAESSCARRYSTQPMRATSGLCLPIAKQSPCRMRNSIRVIDRALMSQTVMKLDGDRWVPRGNREIHLTHKALEDPVADR
jgi:twitching motility protein PilT